MRQVLISLMFVLLFVMSSCGEDDKGNTGNTGDSGNSGDTGNTGNTGNTGDTGDTGNTGDSGDSGDTGNTGNTGDTADVDCISQFETRCHNNTIWWYDSCGKKESEKTTCFNECVDGECLPRCPTTDKFCHFHAGLKWADRSLNQMNWEDAIEYCKEKGGRLPTIIELRTLVRNCPKSEYPKPDELDIKDWCIVGNDGCLSIGCNSSSCDSCPMDDSGKYSVFGHYRGWFWSISETDNGGDWKENDIWIISFNSATLDYYDRTNKNNDYALCVQ